MNFNNIHENYLNEINIYVQMFPKLDHDVIKLVLEEASADDVIDILLNISNDIENDEVKPSEPSTDNEPAILHQDRNFSNHSSLNDIPSVTHQSYRTPENSEEQPLISENDDYTHLFDISDNTSRTNSGLFSSFGSLFRRKSTYKQNRYNPDDNL